MGEMRDEAELIEKLRKVEALFADTSFAGERAAAESARDRILRRLAEIERTEPAVEMRFSMPDMWSRSLFLALLRRYDIEPYRYPRQRHTSVMARVTKTFAEQVLWPEFQQLNDTLREHLESVTRRVVSEAIHASADEAVERKGEPPRSLGPG